MNEINSYLSPVESQVLAGFEKNRLPLVLVMGNPRSGTTLFLQWLASLGHLAYPTNLLSRFYGAPYIGAKIQLMLTKHDFNNEIFDFNPAVPFSSRLGKTKGALAPNEFWYFWRRFFHYGEIQCLSDEELAKVDHAGFVREIAAIEAAFGMPFAMKGMIVNWNIPFMADILDRVLFVNIRRNPFFNMQSLLRTRLDYYGDIRGWYSFKPPEYAVLKDKDPYEQVAGQIHFSRLAVENGLAGVDEARKLTIDYEDFCREPEKVFGRIVERFRQQGCPVDWAYTGPASFDVANRVSLSPQEVGRVVDAYRNLTGETLEV